MEKMVTGVHKKAAAWGDQALCLKVVGIFAFHREHDDEKDHIDEHHQPDRDRMKDEQCRKSHDRTGHEFRDDVHEDVHFCELVLNCQPGVQKVMVSLVHVAEILQQRVF